MSTLIATSGLTTPLALPELPIAVRRAAVKQVLKPGEEMEFSRVQLVLTSDAPVGLVWSRIRT